MWEVIELIVNLFQAVIVIETITQYLQIKYEDCRRIFFPGIATAIVFIELSFVNRKTHFEGLAILIPIAIIYCYALLFLKGSWKKKLYSCIFVMLLIISISSITMNAVAFVSGYSYQSLAGAKGGLRLLILCTVQILIFYATRIFIRQRTKDKGKISSKIWGIILAIPFVSIVVLSALMEISVNINYMKDTKIVTMLIMASCGIMSLNILTYYIFVKLRQDSVKMLEYEVLRERYYMQEKSTKEIKELHCQLQKARHDIKHHLNILLNFVNEEKYEEARNYLEQYTDAFDFLQNKIIFCNNDILNYVINSRLSRMKKAKVDFKYKICEKVEGIEDIDLNIVLCNLLDNAIEACEKETCEKKEIYLSLHKRAGYLVVIVENTFYGSMKHLEHLHTSKADKINHGYGLLSVRNVLEKCNGSLQVLHEDGKICMKAIMEVK